MTLQEYEAQGGCEGCLFYCTIDVDGRKCCTFEWFDDGSDDWNLAKNCDEISEKEPHGWNINKSTDAWRALR